MAMNLWAANSLSTKHARVKNAVAVVTVVAAATAAAVAVVVATAVAVVEAVVVDAMAATTNVPGATSKAATAVGNPIHQDHEG